MIHIYYFVSCGVQKHVLFEDVKNATAFLQTIKPQQLNSIRMKDGSCYRNEKGYYDFFGERRMKFIIKDLYGHLSDFEDEVFEFESLEEFVRWSVQVELPRFIFVPPHSKGFMEYGYQNITDNWMIYCYSDYD